MVIASSFLNLWLYGFSIYEPSDRAVIIPLSYECNLRFSASSKSFKRFVFQHNTQTFKDVFTYHVPDKSDTLERKQYFTVNGSKMYWMAEYVCSHLATLRKNNHFKWPFFGLDLLFPLSSIYVPSIWPLNDTQQPPIHQWRGGTYYNISLIFPWDVKSTMPLGKDYKYHFHFHKKSCLACCIRVLVRKLRHFYGLRPKSTLLHIFPLILKIQWCVYKWNTSAGLYFTIRS